MIISSVQITSRHTYNIFLYVRFTTNTAYGPISVYKSLVKKGITREDRYQLIALEKLEELHHDILIYDQKASSKRNSLLNFDDLSAKSSSKPLSIMSNWLMSTKIKEIEPEITLTPPKSIYLYGGMLMMS